MSINYGKKFEQKFREDFKRTIPGGFLLRLIDTQGGMYGVSNPCDFIVYNNQNLYLVECKAHKGNTWPLTNFRQYDKLLPYDSLDGVYPGVLLWFIDHNKVIWVPISTVESMIRDNKKSINIKMLDENNYDIIEVPSKLRRTFMDSDYSTIFGGANGNSGN